MDDDLQIPPPQVKLHHPSSDDLAFLYGTILTDGRDQHSAEPTANLCVFAEAQVGGALKKARAEMTHRVTPVSHPPHPAPDRWTGAPAVPASRPEWLCSITKA